MPVRVYKNKNNIGVGYPTRAMQIEATLWDGDSWATDGGQTKTNWSYAPFKAYFKGFDIDGCQLQPSSSSNFEDNPNCASDRYWWNGQKFRQLDPALQNAYENVKKNFMTYDYCSDKQRYPTPPPECI